MPISNKQKAIIALISSIVTFILSFILLSDSFSKRLLIVAIVSSLVISIAFGVGVYIRLALWDTYFEKYPEDK